jgi:hypothetical protein
MLRFIPHLPDADAHSVDNLPSNRSIDNNNQLIQRPSTMKVFLHYEDNKSKFLHKTLKITLPKKWKEGPTSKLLEFAVESYNASDLGKSNTLVSSELHLALKIASEGEEEGTLTPLASDATLIEVIDDRDAVYIIHGPSRTLAQIEQEIQDEKDRKKELLASTVPCVHFGCKNRFKPDQTPPACTFHKSPPVFHETAKFWSCCPQKKVYDWEDFQAIPGCETGFCTDVKEENSKQFLGGCDLRDASAPAKLKTIDDFNATEAAGGSSAAPVLDRLRAVLAEAGVENELFDQVFDGIKKEIGEGEDELGAATEELGSKLKKAFKSIAVEQLRIK